MCRRRVKVNTFYIRKRFCVGGMNTFCFQVVSDVPFGHEREDKVRVAFGSVKAHSQQTHNVGVVESLHQKTLVQQ